MKMLTNLPRNLRVLFALLRFMTVAFAALWLLMLTYNAWFKGHNPNGTGPTFTFGEVWLKTAPNAVGLSSDTAKPGALGLVDLRGTVKVDLLSDDPMLLSAVCWSAIPGMLVVTAFLWLLFGSLRRVCANIEHGEVFSERNLLLVRRIGWIFIANSILGFAVALWAGHLMGGYLGQHVALTGINAGPLHPGGAGAVGYATPSGMIPLSGVDGLVVG